MDKQTSKKELHKQRVAQADAIMKKHNLRIVHIRRGVFSEEQKGGCTVAYYKQNPNDRVIWVSVALVNNKDAYCKLEGRFLACTKFTQGESLQLRVPKNMRIAAFLQSTFATMVNG